VKPDAGTNVVEGETATGQPNESFNLDVIDTAIALLQDKVPAASADYAASGAITQKSGLVTISKTGVAAMTLADPVTVTDDAKVLRIVSKTAQAHTVTLAGGFEGGSLHVATFGGAIGDMLCVLAVAGKWYALPSVNQTLSAS
jgi:hypothetical protein